LITFVDYSKPNLRPKSSKEILMKKFNLRIEGNSNFQLQLGCMEGKNFHFYFKELNYSHVLLSHEESKFNQFLGILDF
jgi:hypothetical protein